MEQTCHETNTSGSGELDGIADEVNEDLSQPDWVRKDGIRYRIDSFHADDKAFCVRRPGSMATAVVRISQGEHSTRSTSSLLLSILDRSKISLMICSRCLAFRTMASANSMLRPGSFDRPMSFCRSSAKPMMEVMGVRIS